MSFSFIFPGQGSQFVGMLSRYAGESVIQDTFAEASDCLNYDMWSLAQNGPEAQMNMTEYTQPLLLTASVALWRLWHHKGNASPTIMAGHSLGEFSALVCAEALQLGDALRLVQKRGQLMQEAVPAGEGSMAAIIGLADNLIEEGCRKVSQEGSIVQIANWNAPNQIVIAGHTAAVSKACETCKHSGAKRTIMLPVSAPFHCALMRPASEKFAQFLHNIPLTAPTIPVVHNVHAQEESDSGAIKDLLVRQMYCPVCWVKCIKIIASAVKSFVECGAGRVLCNLNKRINPAYQTESIEDMQKGDV